MKFKISIAVGALLVGASTLALADNGGVVKQGPVITAHMVDKPLDYQMELNYSVTGINSDGTSGDGSTSYVMGDTKSATLSLTSLTNFEYGLAPLPKMPVMGPGLEVTSFGAKPEQSCIFTNKDLWNKGLNINIAVHLDDSSGLPQLACTIE